MRKPATAGRLSQCARGQLDSAGAGQDLFPHDRHQGFKRAAQRVRRPARALPWVRSRRELTCRCQLRNCETLLGRNVRQGSGSHADLPTWKTTHSRRKRSIFPSFLLPVLKMASVVQVSSTTTQAELQSHSRSQGSRDHCLTAYLASSTRH